MTDPDDQSPPPTGDDGDGDAPTVSCNRCGEEWSLAYELDDLQVGNQAVEKFALDHQQHTGHLPDDVSPWIADCRRCPETVELLSERGSRRWAETHARHTRHIVEIRHQSLENPVTVDR